MGRKFARRKFITGALTSTAIFLPVVVYSKTILTVQSHITPEQFGAVGDGVADDTGAFERFFLHLVTENKGGSLGPRQYRLQSPILVNLGSRTLNLKGTGPGISTILIDHDETGLKFSGLVNAMGRVRLHGFTVARVARNPSVAKVGPKGLLIRFCDDVVISNVEEVGGIGFGLHIDYSSNIVIHSCIVRDHVSGSNHHSGTDGIHLTNCTDGEVFGNTVFNIGDDGISAGSFLSKNPSRPTERIFFHDNKLYNLAGSLKLYGAVIDVTISHNDCEKCANGGITLWDDRETVESHNISNVTISDNRIIKCGRHGASGGVYITQTKGDGNGVISNIKISGNTIIDCPYGISIASFVVTKYSTEIRIIGNKISSSQVSAVFLKDVRGYLEIKSNCIDKTNLVRLKKLSKFLFPLRLEDDGS